MGRPAKVGGQAGEALDVLPIRAGREVEAEQFAQPSYAVGLAQPPGERLGPGSGLAEKVRHFLRRRHEGTDGPAYGIELSLLGRNTAPEEVPVMILEEADDLDRVQRLTPRRGSRATVVHFDPVLSH